MISRLFEYLNQKHVLGTFILASMGLRSLSKGWAGGTAVSWSLGAIFIIVAAALFLQKRWCRYPAILLLVGVGAMRGFAAFQAGFTSAAILPLLGMVVALWVAREIYVWEDPEEPSDMVSLIHLRRWPAYYTAEQLAQLLSEAWGVKLIVGKEEGSEDDDTADGFVVGKLPVFMVMVKRSPVAVYTVHVHDQPYFEEPEAVQQSTRNLRFRQAISQHKAWCSVDILDDKVDRNRAYQQLGKALAAMADDDVMAVMCPEDSQFNLWQPDFVHILRGDNPRAVFEEEVLAPMVNVEDGDAIAAAKAEARRRWPEFISHFQAHTPEGLASLVKAAFTADSGEVEHMWIIPTAVTQQDCSGTLMNSPFYCTHLKQKDQVTVQLEDISDWIFRAADGQPVGNFTGPVISESKV
jgi:uncharacterized protein YegJ (DUF2314 family)